MPKAKRKYSARTNLKYEVAKILEPVCTSNTSRSTDISETPQPTDIHENKALESQVNIGQSTVEKIHLTTEQRARIELNRQKALLIRQDKLNRKKIYNQKEETTRTIRINDQKLVDTGGGFFIEQSLDGVAEEDLKSDEQIVKEPAPLLKEDQPFCNDCSMPFNNSYLQTNFACSVCDQCRDSKEKHCLITKTDAKVNYLMKDVDFDKREPPLKFILRKNPHNVNWGDMKLYLKIQVEKRALEIWDTEEKLENALEDKEEKREIMKQKKYMKKMKELRMNVRSSLYTKPTKYHEHEYGDEEYLSESDEFKKTCGSCGHSYVYEKM